MNNIDRLEVMYDKDEKGIVITRTDAQGNIEMLKADLDDQADMIYRVLTDQSIKIDKLREEHP